LDILDNKPTLMIIVDLEGLFSITTIKQYVSRQTNSLPGWHIYCSKDGLDYLYLGSLSEQHYDLGNPIAVVYMLTFDEVEARYVKIIINPDPASYLLSNEIQIRDEPTTQAKNANWHQIKEAMKP